MPGAVFLEGDRLNLRVVESEDYEYLSQLFNNPAVRKHEGGLRTPYDGDDVETIVELEDVNGFLACLDGDPVGRVMIMNVNLEASNAELGYMINPDEAGNGYATEAADLCLSHAFDGLGLHKVYARTHEANEASQRVLEKLGFEQEGVFRSHSFSFGEFADEYRFGLLASEWRAGKT